MFHQVYNNRDPINDFHDFQKCLNDTDLIFQIIYRYLLTLKFTLVAYL